jgi:hypothetical protein
LYWLSITLIIWTSNFKITKFINYGNWCCNSITQAIYSCKRDRLKSLEQLSFCIKVWPLRQARICRKGLNDPTTFCDDILKAQDYRDFSLEMNYHPLWQAWYRRGTFSIIVYKGHWRVTRKVNWESKELGPRLGDTVLILVSGVERI